MDVPGMHLRWRLALPTFLEDAAGAWLEAHGATATFREAPPGDAFYAYFPPGARPGPAGLEALGVRIEAEERFADEDWIAKSREGFGRIEIGSRFLVLPAWEPAEEGEGRIPIRVNPGLAFGTGGHETTRLCMEFLEKLAAAGRLAEPVLDVGAGTGILALTAHLLGAERILAFDLDPDCGPAMAEFAEENRAILRHPDPFQGFVARLEDPRIAAAGPYRTLLANILLETIVELLPGLAELAAPGGLLVASGILREREDEAMLALATGGFRPLEIAREGEWVAILAERGA